MKLTKPELKALERLFSDEIHGLPTQLPKNNKAIYSLELKYLAYQVSVETKGRFSVTINGWALTPLGHLTWCQHCVKAPEPK